MSNVCPCHGLPSRLAGFLRRFLTQGATRIHFVETSRSTLHTTAVLLQSVGAWLINVRVAVFHVRF